MDVIRTNMDGMASLATRMNAVFDAGQVLHDQGLKPEFIVGLDHATIRVGFAGLPDIADPDLSAGARSAIREAYATACSDDLEDDIPAGPPAQPADSAEPPGPAGNVAGEGAGPEEPEGATLPDEGSAPVVAGAGAPIESSAPQSKPPFEAVQGKRPADTQKVSRAPSVATGLWTEEEIEMLVERMASARVYGRTATKALEEVAELTGRRFEAVKTKSYAPPVAKRINAKVSEMAALRDKLAIERGSTSVKQEVPPAPPVVATRPAPPQSAPGPRQAVAERPSEPTEIVPMWQRELRALLNAVGYPAPFTPAIDLEILERQSRGEKAHEIALDLGIDVVRLRQRVIALLPDTGMQAQARLLGELRLRAGVEA
jgi:hypothetical protein